MDDVKPIVFEAGGSEVPMPAVAESGKLRADEISDFAASDVRPRTRFCSRTCFSSGFFGCIAGLLAAMLLGIVPAANLSKTSLGRGSSIQRESDTLTIGNKRAPENKLDSLHMAFRFRAKGTAGGSVLRLINVSINPVQKLTCTCESPSKKTFTRIEKDVMPPLGLVEIGDGNDWQIAPGQHISIEAPGYASLHVTLK